MTVANPTRSYLRVLALAVLGLFSYSALAATYSVSTTGSDSNPGTSASPWRTIQKAANTMVAGDTVTVNAGTYNERVQVTRSDFFGSPITYQANGRVVMKGFTIKTSYVSVTGFEITDTNDDDVHGVGIYMDGSYNKASNNNIHDIARQGFKVKQNQNIIKGNRIFRAGHAGIWLAGTNHLAEGNDISRTIQYPAKWANPPSWVDADGIIVDGRAFTIRQNYIHDIRGDDPENSGDPHIDTFQIWGNNEGRNIIVEQNILSIPRSTKYSRCYQVANISGVAGLVNNITFRNNVIYNMCRGLNFLGSATNQMTGIKILNNTWYDLDDYSVILNKAPNAVIKNNIYHTMDKRYVLLTTTSTGGFGYNLVYKGTGTTYHNDLVGVDPKFVNLGARDFHLQSTSPAINAGTTLSEVTNDKDGVSRPQGSAYDIGAYERSGT